MNKKNVTLIMVGVLIQVLEFTVNINGMRFDIFSDVIAFALILIGIMPLIGRNNLFRKSKNTAIQGLIIAIFVQAINLVDLGTSTTNLDSFTKGLITIFAIYFTYYFTESIMLEAKFQDKAALTRNFRITWAVLGVLVFVSYIAFVSNISIISIIVQSITLLCAIYYASTVLTTCEKLYTDELPQ